MKRRGGRGGTQRGLAGSATAEEATAVRIMFQRNRL